MSFSDIFWLFFIFAFCLIINGGQIFTLENLVKAAVGAVIVIAILVVIYLDYSPLWRLKAAELAFYDDLDMERTMAAIETFKKKNRKPDKAYKGYLLESQIQLMMGNFTDAMDALLYIEQKGLDIKDRLRAALLRCKIQIFMGTLTPENTDYRYCWENRGNLLRYDLFNLLLIRGYLQLTNDRMEQCEKTIRQLRKFEDIAFIEKPLIDNEIRWLESMLAAADQQEETYKKQFNLLKGMNCLPYIITSFTRNH